MDILPPIVAGTAAYIGKKDYNGAGANLAMMTAGVDHVLHASRNRGLDTSQLEAIKAVSDRANAKGHAADSWASAVEALGGRAGLVRGLRRPPSGPGEDPGLEGCEGSRWGRRCPLTAKSVALFALACGDWIDWQTTRRGGLASS
ncbi:hypothetical protein ACF08M_17640 [Streptomyces sp. NPDC015032]|uniref:imine reductase family protein n=1 Tax=Streptomyces sp. NPDC015032 TaxID=3364937 RepID=UPI0036F67334